MTEEQLLALRAQLLALTEAERAQVLAPFRVRRGHVLRGTLSVDSPTP